MLLQPFNSGSLGILKNRVVMSAMTRGFAAAGHLATLDMAKYYGRRAEDGVALILTEGVIVDPRGDGYNNVPHMQTKEQAESWKPVLQRVHAANTRMVCQLWHCGRISHADFTGGHAPLSSTTAQAAGMNRQNGKPFGIPEALDAHGIQEIHSQFAQSASLAIDAGFDAVQLHCGHGYICDQFLDSRVNDRTDAYGGSIENRCRFTLELIDRIVREVGAAKVMVRLSPSRMMNGLYDWNDLDAMLTHLVASMRQLGVCMLDISCANADYYQTSGRVLRQIRKEWPHLLIGGASLTQQQAQDEIANGWLDAVTWGRRLIANPDMVSRMASGQALTEFDVSMTQTLV